MKDGTLCHIKCKRNALTTYVVLYPNLDEVIEARTKRNQWFPSIVSQTNIKIPLSSNQPVCLKPTKQSFAVLDQTEDCNGNLYYRCLYNDSYGWIINNRKAFELEETNIWQTQT